MRTQDFDFFLPAHLIAQHPTLERTASRLLKLDGATGQLDDTQFNQLVSFLKPNDLLIFNDTKVIKARLFGEKSTGGKVEVLIERVLAEQSTTSDHSQQVLAHVKASRSPKIGSEIRLENAFNTTVISRQDDLFLLEIHSADNIFKLLEQHGHLPLPPYINHAADTEDEARYQTVYANKLGAVAAPTAGLHFDEAMLSALKQHGVHIGFVTLHVGAGTFQPVKMEDISQHKMHFERYEIPQATVDLIQLTKKQGGKITAIGTTAMRALESAAQTGEIVVSSGDTNIFITPGYTFKVVERLITNFHLPKSTLMMLVSAFAGIENIKKAYQHAIQQEYRFFSYGDAMLIDKKQDYS